MVMENIDEADLKILAELDSDGRASVTDVAEITGLSAYKIKHRIKEMEESGIIKKYACIPDLFRIGYRCYSINLRLQHVNGSTEKEIMDHLCQSSLTTWCGFASGRFDIAAFIWFDRHERAVSFWEDFMLGYRQYVRETVIVPYCGDTQMGLPFTNSSKKSRPVTTGLEGIRVDKKDRDILSILSMNGRATLEEVGNAVGLEPASVSYRINNLVKKKVIASFRADIDTEKIGYQCYKVDFNLGSMAKKKEIEKYIMAKPACSNIIRTIGWADLEIEVYAKSSKELSGILHEIRDGFPDDIQDFEFFEYYGKAKDSWNGILLGNGN